MKDAELLLAGASQLRIAAAGYSHIIRLLGDEHGQLAACVQSETATADALEAMARRIIGLPPIMEGVTQ